MNQSFDHSSQLSASAPAPPGGYPMRPQVVHVVSKPGGFWRAVSIIGGLFLFAAVFGIGLFIGILIMIAGASYESMVVRETYRDGGSPTIAIVPVEGLIDDVQAQFVRAAVDDIIDNGPVDAVILRVDSPGGGVTASDQIWYEVNRLKEKRIPVVASFGGLAASGGYYVSCAADHIVAEETCITGSIGVIAQILTLEGLLGKVGISPVTLVASGSPEKNVANDIFRTWNEADKAKVQTMLDAAYEVFNRRVRDGRKGAIPNPESIDALANGSIYTAQEAKENGLVDSLGYLDDAIAMAETRAGIPTGSSTVFTVRMPPTLAGALLGAQAGAGANRQLSSMDADSIRGLVNDLASPRVMYLMR